MEIINFEYVKFFLEQKVSLYNRPQFIENDPIFIPHQYTGKQDIEIMGFFASIFAWGQRSTIINKAKELGQRMDNAPYEFMIGHGENDLKNLLGFKHRTFNDTDLLYCIEFLKNHYKNSETLEDAFFPEAGLTVEEGLNHFNRYFFNYPDAPSRTRKHISCPKKKSACKRLNMFLRWMVRDDDSGVDFGIWKKISPGELICPLDLHVERTARKMGLLSRDKPDWQAAVELTENLRRFDPQDPVKYDFALFGISIEEKCMLP